jgi:hypothetical protein
MSELPSRLAVLSVAVLTVIGSSAATGFTCTRTPALGPSVFWPDRSVVVHPLGGGFEVAAGSLVDVMVRATETWTAPSCSDASISVGSPPQQRVVGFNWHAGSGSPLNENIVVFRNDTPGDELDRWVHTLGALAITTVTFDTSTGRLLDADIEINDVAFTFTACDPGSPGCEPAFDLENTLTHELGHVMGLDHPPNDAPGALEATMFASASETDTEKRSLADDDIDGLCTLYPASSAEPGECYGVGRARPASITFDETLCAHGSAGARWAPIAALGGWLTLSRLRRRHLRVCAEPTP